jgi:hypothetical protein
LLIGSGLTYLNSSSVATAGDGTRVAASYTTGGFKVYEFQSGTGSVQF